jgi:hypothetical protein
MDRDEKIALKAACIQAAAILLAPASLPPIAGGKAAADTANCARHARDLFVKLTGVGWD